MKHTFGSLDDKFAEYATQWILSDGDTYRRSTDLLIYNYAKKVFRGEYDSKRAIEGYIHVIESVLPRIKRDYNEYHEGERYVTTVSRDTKVVIAREMMAEYEETLRDRVDHLLRIEQNLQEAKLKQSLHKSKPEDYIRREVKSRMKKEKPAYERVASFYDVTQVAKNGEQSFVAKTKTLDTARMIANKTADATGVKEARIIKWYPRKDGTKGFKVKETYSKHRKEVKERKVF